MRRNAVEVHSSIRKCLGYDGRTSARTILADWTERTRRICKPCWELKYCPYGPWVENSPILPPMLEAAKHHDSYLRECLASGRFADGATLDAARREYFEAEVQGFDPKDYPHLLPQVLVEASCVIFGHICPVYFVFEGITETKDTRLHTRNIPRDVMLKVVRRDGQICQSCFQHVPDDQIEFDHLIPFGKGGRTTVDNLRVLCRDCNRGKRDEMTDILADDVVERLKTQVKAVAKKVDRRHRSGSD